MPRMILLSCAALVLASCGQPPAVPSQPITTLAVTTHDDRRAFSSSGARIWAEGARIWAEGARIWAEGARIWAEGSYVLLPSSTSWLRQIRADEAHARTSRAGAGVTIALIDSGVDMAHPMLQGALLLGHDFVEDDRDPSEAEVETDSTYGHGTAVAGVLRQVAPGARILPLRVLGPDGSGKAGDVAQAIRMAVDSGAQIINLSVAAPVATEGVRAALQYAASGGVLVVAASGNDGGKRPQAPADALNGSDRLGRYGISVTAVDHRGALPSWSNRGGEIHAPGVALNTAYPGGRLVTASGSSFAAPVVAGALALALAEGRDAQTLAAQVTSGGLLDAAALLR